MSNAVILANIMKSTSQQSRLSTGFKLASLLTLFLGMANAQTIRAEVQSVQSFAPATIESDLIEPVPVSVATAWQNDPVALPVQASHIGLIQDGQRAIAISNRSSKTEGISLEVWDIQTRERIFSAPATENMRFEAAAISNDGLQVAAIVQNQDRELRLWTWNIASDQPPTQTLLNTPRPFFGPAFSHTSSDNLSNFAVVSSEIAFSPDATKIVTSVKRLSDRTDTERKQVLRLHSAVTGDVLHTFAPTTDSQTDAQIEQLTFSPDSEQLVGVGRRTSGDNSTGLVGSFSVVNLWQTRDGQLVSSLSPDEAIAGAEAPTASNYVAAVAFTPDGQLKTLSNSNLVSDQLVTWTLSNPAAFSQVQTLPEVDRQDFIHVLSPDGIYHFMRGDVAGTRLLNTQTLEVVRIDERVSEAAFSADGDYLAIATPENVQIFFKGDR